MTGVEAIYNVDSMAEGGEKRRVRTRKERRVKKDK